MSRIKNWTKMKAAELWSTWRVQFENEDEAILTAIWIGNRLVKDKAKSTRRKFYSIKDEFITRNQAHLIDGRKVREEYDECWDCRGTGHVYEVLNRNLSEEQETQVYYWSRDMCEGDPPEGVRVKRQRCAKCGGTGKYRPRWLYSHTFSFDGRVYRFHSYQKPVKLSDEPGEDLEQYGGKFTEAELADLSLPMTGILRALSYVAAAIWGLTLDRSNGTYFRIPGWTEEA